MRELSGMPYKCHRCGVVLCEHYRLPEKHGCKVTPPRPTNIRIQPVRHYWKTFRKMLTLKNFTTISILLMLVGFLPSYFPLNNYREIFQSAIEIGIVCFVIAYCLYALKCWGATSQICAVLMITLPLLAYFLSTSKIPGSTSNILFYLAIQFCFYAIISAILLYLSDKMKMGIEWYMRRLHRLNEMSPTVITPKHSLKQMKSDKTS